MGFPLRVAVENSGGRGRATAARQRSWELDAEGATRATHEGRISLQAAELHALAAASAKASQCV